MRAERLAAAVLGLMLVAGCARGAPPAMLTDRVAITEVIALPTPRTTGTVTLEEAIAARRSVRAFSTEPLPRRLVGQLLWAAQGITAPDGKRAAPSAGALYPLELYVVEPTALLHYLPDGHRVERRADVDRRPDLGAAAFDQSFVGSAPALVVIAAVFERTQLEYGALGHDLVNREAGHAAENLLLEATALGLGAVPVGGFDPRAVETALALPPGCRALYLIPVGYPDGAPG
jgi:SagB-type dehydrogenase family enzyme